MTDIVLSEIWIYPIKSLGGIQLTTAKVFEKGLLHDRRWMLVDEQGTFMTQRVFPEMALFKLSINAQSEVITVTRKNASKNISLSFDPRIIPKGNPYRAKIWDDDVDVQEVDPAISEWFSLHLDVKVKFVAFPEENERPVDPKYKVNDEHVSLADAYPFLIIGQNALELLNSKLKVPIPMNRFRPNFVFTGGKPHDEDKWRNFSIGNTRFVGVKLCVRCAVPTIDQETAKKGIEPSATLATYRSWDNKIWFGQNLVALDYNQVFIGDKIVVN